MFQGRKTFVLGLARSGLATAQALLAGGAQVVCWDDADSARARAEDAGLTVLAPERADWLSIDALIASPGIPLAFPAPHPAVALAKAAHVEVIGDVELFFRAVRALQPACKIVAVTGTNGKSTTTALIGHILSRAGYDVEVGGNIGRAALTLAPPKANRAYVLEMSSYQLDLTPSCHPDVAVLLNITPDHLDRHGGMEGYCATKARIFSLLKKGDVAVVGTDDEPSAGLCTRLLSRNQATVCPVSAGKVLGRGVYVLSGRLYDAQGAAAREVCDLRKFANLPGAHNWQNAAAAFAATRSLVKDAQDIAAALATFPGLEHRMEQAGRIGRVSFVNDSKATNADATAKAMACYSAIYWIAGGKGKDGGVQGLERFSDRVRGAYLIGASAKDFAGQLDGHMPVQMCGDLETAMRAALRDAAAGNADDPVVLLSPAAASFDQFRDFEHRGAEFKRVAALLAEEARLKGAA
jgi:UDP-N-acetylmuramoylalanine--D-glutamate ligase